MIPPWGDRVFLVRCSPAMCEQSCTTTGKVDPPSEKSGIPSSRGNSSLAADFSSVQRYSGYAKNGEARTLISIAGIRPSAKRTKKEKVCARFQNATSQPSVRRHSFVRFACTRTVRYLNNQVHVLFRTSTRIISLLVARSPADIISSHLEQRHFPPSVFATIGRCKNSSNGHAMKGGKAGQK